MAASRSYHCQEFGTLYKDDYRMFFMQDQKPISPFHDIPLFVDKDGKAVEANANTGIFNMVVEIPRWTNAKMEISRDEPLNPIKQDSKKNKPRFVHNVFPHKGYIWNYGAFPQTWEDPEHVSPETGCKGDRDPLDVCEIGFRVAKRGEVLQVKPLGIIALCDEGETDWKVIVIDVHDPLADELNDIEDVEKYMPGLIQTSVDWFRYYKIPDGKPPNTIAFDGQAKGREVATKVLYETHDYWRKLVMEKSNRGPEWSCLNTRCKGSPFMVSPDEVNKVMDKQGKQQPAAPWDPALDTWHFIDREAAENSVARK